MADQQHFGYMVDLTGVQFADDANGAPTSWIQCMPLGTYNHPFFGEIEFTPEKLKQFAASVHNQVRDTELDIDYDHKMNSGEAAGWVKDAEVRDNDGLWIFVEWTKTAAGKIKEKAYKYFSPEFAEKWQHPKTGAIYQNVLFGGGITNRPFLKDIIPLNLSELVKESGGNTTVINQVIAPTQPAHQGGGNKMATKKFSELSLSEVQTLAKALGLGEDTTAGAVQAALGEMSGAPASTTQVVTPPAAPVTPEAQQTHSELVKQLTENGHLDEATMQSISALVSDNPANKVLAEVIEHQQIELAQTGQALRFAEAQAKITKLAERAIQKKMAFPAAVQDELRDILIDLPKQHSDKVYGLMEKLALTGMVQLGELGRSYRGDIGQTAKLTIDERARQLMASDTNLKYADAVERVTRDDPKVFNDYRSDVMELD